MAAKGKGWFKIGNVFIDAHVKNIGVVSAMVYLCIKRHENMGTRYAWPTEQLIADKLGICRKTVGRSIKILKYYGLIVPIKERRGQWLHNKYFLTQSSHWLNEPLTKETYETNIPFTWDKNNQNSESESPINNTNKENKNKNVLLEEQEKEPVNFKKYRPDFLKRKLGD